MAQWDYSREPPEWLTEETRVVHATFGRGTVRRIGRYRNVPTMWIDFDTGVTKALSLEYGLPHLAVSVDDEPKRRVVRRWFRS